MVGSTAAKEKPIVSPFEIHDNLRDANTQLLIPEQYDRIVNTILLPYQEGLDQKGLNEETVDIIIGKTGSGKSIAARQRVLKLATDRRINQVLESKGKRLTPMLLQFDPFLRLTKNLFGIPWEKKASPGVYAWASLGMEYAVHWAHENLSRPWVITIDASVFPYDSLPFPHPGGGRDVGGSAVEAIAQLEYLNVFGTAVLPNKNLEKKIFTERGTLEDDTLTNKVKIKNNETARQKVIELRRSMATNEAMLAVQKIIFDRFDQLIKLDVSKNPLLRKFRLPSSLIDFREDPLKEREAYLRYYTMQCELLFSQDGNFKVVENSMLPDDWEIHTYETVFSNEPVVSIYTPPIKKIMKETVRRIMREFKIGNTFDVILASSENKAA